MSIDTECRSVEELWNFLKRDPEEFKTFHTYYCTCVLSGDHRGCVLVQKCDFMFHKIETQSREYFGWSIYKKFCSFGWILKDPSFEKFNFKQSDTKIKIKILEVLKRAKESDDLDGATALCFLSHLCLIKKIHIILLKMGIEKKILEIYHMSKESSNKRLYSLVFVFHFFKNFCFFESGRKSVMKNSKVIHLIFQQMTVDLKVVLWINQEQHRNKTTSGITQLFQERICSIEAFETIYSIVESEQGSFDLTNLMKQFLQISQNTDSKEKKLKLNIVNYVDNTLFPLLHIINMYWVDDKSFLWQDLEILLKFTSGISSIQLVPLFSTERFVNILTRMFVHFSKAMCFRKGSSRLPRALLSEEIFRGLLRFFGIVMGSDGSNFEKLWKYYSEVIDVATKIILVFIKGSDRSRYQLDRDERFTCQFCQDAARLLFRISLVGGGGGGEDRKKYGIEVLNKCKEFIGAALIDSDFYEYILCDFHHKGEFIGFLIEFLRFKETETFLVSNFRHQIAGFVKKVLHGVVLKSIPRKRVDNDNDDDDNNVEIIFFYDDDRDRVNLLVNVLSMIAIHAEIMECLGVNDVFPSNAPKDGSDSLEKLRDNRSLFGKFYFMYVTGTQMIKFFALQSMCRALRRYPERAREYLKNQDSPIGTFFNFLYFRTKVRLGYINYLKEDPHQKQQQHISDNNKSILKQRIDEGVHQFWLLLDFLEKKDFFTITTIDSGIRQQSNILPSNPSGIQNRKKTRTQKKRFLQDERKEAESTQKTEEVEEKKKKKKKTSIITSEEDSGKRKIIVEKCSSCGKEKATLRCARCKSVFYCDRKCQIAHWEKHKKECRTRKKKMK